VTYEAPLRCTQCGMSIKKKPRAKIPKYCTECREKQQEAWKEQLKLDRQRKVRGR
jgi:hypothetical protein